MKHPEVRSTRLGQRWESLFSRLGSLSGCCSYALKRRIMLTPPRESAARKHSNLQKEQGVKASMDRNKRSEEKARGIYLQGQHALPTRDDNTQLQKLQLLPRRALIPTHLSCSLSFFALLFFRRTRALRFTPYLLAIAQSQSLIVCFRFFFVLKFLCSFLYIA